MKQPNKPILNAAQRLMLRVKTENLALLTEAANVTRKSPSPKVPTPKEQAPIIVWDGKDSLDALLDSSVAIKYRVEDKATKVLGMSPK